MVQSSYYVMTLWSVPLHVGMMLKENNTLKKLNLGECYTTTRGIRRSDHRFSSQYQVGNPGPVTQHDKSASCLGKNDIILLHIHVHLCMVGN